MLGEREARVIEITAFPLHGVTYQDVTVSYRDGSVDQARLGPEGVPVDLRAGETVLAMRAANVIVSLRRPDVTEAPEGR